MCVCVCVFGGGGGGGWQELVIYRIAGNFRGENLRKFRSLKPIRESFLREIVSGRNVTSGSGYPNSFKHLHVLERRVK